MILCRSTVLQLPGPQSLLANFFVLVYIMCILLTSADMHILTHKIVHVNTQKHEFTLKFCVYLLRL